METIAKTRRAYVVQWKSIKAISRELRVARKTVRKVIRSEETEFAYERRSQAQPKIGTWRDELDRLLAANAARSSRERLTLIRVADAADGGLDARFCEALGATDRDMLGGLNRSSQHPAEGGCDGDEEEALQQIGTSEAILARPP